jgi:hypothetical protein
MIRNDIGGLDVQMADIITGGPKSKRVFVSYKEISVSEDSLAAADILIRAGFHPAAYELSFSDTGERINYDRELKIKDGMKMKATVKS